jgi:heat shock protein 4
MSVVGFDVGNDTSCVALARKRGIDVLMNKESKRETPSCISFGDKMRFMGTDGAAKISMNPKNTVHQLKRLIGKRWADPEVQADVAKLPFSVTAAPDGGILVNVMFCNERQSFTPEQLMAMVLVDLKKIAEAEGGIPVVDCCISVPAFYTEQERYAMLAAASTAGLNCLRLINETTATAIAYGIYKTDLPETDPVNVVFVDIGHAATQVRRSRAAPPPACVPGGVPALPAWPSLPATPAGGAGPGRRTCLPRPGAQLRRRPAADSPPRPAPPLRRRCLSCPSSAAGWW